jgi:hypothetical protein
MLPFLHTNKRYKDNILNEKYSSFLYRFFYNSLISTGLLDVHVFLILVEPLRHAILQFPFENAHKIIIIILYSLAAKRLSYSSFFLLTIKDIERTHVI